MRTTYESGGVLVDTSIHGLDLVLIECVCRVGCILPNLKNRREESSLLCPNSLKFKRATAERRIGTNARLGEVEFLHGKEDVRTRKKERRKERKHEDRARVVVHTNPFTL